MNLHMNNKGGKTFAPWIVLLVLAVSLFFVPSVVLAQNYELSQECAVAFVDSEHTVTATVTDGSGNPLVGTWVAFFIHGQNSAYQWKQTDASGVAQHTYTGIGGAGLDTIELWDMYSVTVADMVTTWTDDPQDPALLACAGSSSQSVVVGGRVILNAKKKGALTIALCSADGLDLDRNVDLKTVQLAGVAPWHSKYKDSRLCPGGKDGTVDLVLKFKNRKVVKALEDSLGELEDGQEVDLTLTGSLSDGTVLDGVWQAVIKKESKRHCKKKHKKEKKHKEKKCKKR